MTRARLLILAILVAVVGPGVILAVTRTQADPAGASGDLSQARRFAATLTFTWVDFDPARGPNELAQRSDVVAIGRIVTFRQGRYIAGNYEDDDPSLRARTAVMQVAVERVVAGRLPDPADPNLYFEFSLNRRSTPAALAAAAPNGALILVYADAIAPDPVYEGLVHDEGAGKPAGQPLMRFTTPQGFLMEVGGRIFRVLQPSQPLQDPRIRLSDLMPPNELFPMQLWT